MNNDRGPMVNRKYKDLRYTITRQGLLDSFPEEWEERVLVIGNWIMMLRASHAILFDRLWRIIEQSFPDEVEEARERIRECDRQVKAQQMKVKP